MQISRLFNMLYILLERERVTAAELSRELEVSVRTVYRDAQALCEAGVPLYSEQGRGGGLSILPTYKLSKSLLSEDEQRSILASLAAAAQSGAQDRALLGKLRAFFGAQAQDWVQIDFADWSGQQDSDIRTFRQAILERHLLAFDYYGESGQMTAREVCPFKLWFKGQSWYLRSFCLTRHGIRTFKLSRIKRPRIVPGEFPQDALAAQQSDAPTTDWPEPSFIHLTLRVDGCMAFRIFDDFSEEHIARQADGSFIVNAGFPPGAWIKSIILSYGEHAEVLEPESLRNEIRDTLRNTIQKYDSKIRS